MFWVPVSIKLVTPGKTDIRKGWIKERDELIYQLKHDDVIERMDAAGGLLAFKEDPQTASPRAAAVQTDPFWAVLKSALEALAQLKDKSGPAVFKKACQDPDSQVRAAEGARKQLEKK